MIKLAVYAAAVLLSGSVAFAGETSAFPVDSSNATWQNSAVPVKAGQHVEVEADAKDTWNIGWGDANAGGYTFQLNANTGVPQFHAGTANKDWHWAALICGVGKDRKEASDPQNEVEIGMKRGFTVDRDGFLFFICNDNANPPAGSKGYEKNSGIVHITVSVNDGEKSTGTPSNIAFDARDDYSPTQNPHGAWTYGWTDEMGGKLHVYTNTYVRYSGTCWTDSSIEDSWAPIVGYHPVYVEDDPSRAPAKTMMLHPGPRGEFSHCSWKAPKAGFYDINASMTALDFGGPHGYILKNGSSLGDSQLSEGKPWSQSYKAVELAEGDTIDATLGVGSSGSFHNDITIFSLSITPATAPKPSATLVSAVVEQLRSPLKDMVRQAVEEALKEKGLVTPSKTPTGSAGQEHPGSDSNSTPSVSGSATDTTAAGKEQVPNTTRQVPK